MARPFLIVLPVPFGLEDVLGLRTFITAASLAVASRISVAYKLLDCKTQLKRFRLAHSIHDETSEEGEKSKAVRKRSRGWRGGEGRSAPRMIQVGIQGDAHRGGRTEFGRRREPSTPDRSRGSPRRSTPEGRWREIPARFARIPGTFGAGRFWF